MLVAHYRLSMALAASLSLVLASCGSSPPAGQASAPAAAADPTQDALKTQIAAAKAPRDIDTEATIWTVLGLAKKQSVREPGPQTGSTVSPILWQAALDTLDFVKFSSQDPLTGELVSNWYSPPGKPGERYKINVFVLSRALRSDSVAVTVDRQQQSPTGEWVKTTIARQVEDDLETAILRRAGQLKRAWMKAYASQ